MLRTPKTQFTAAEYLALEKVSEFRHEYCKGEIFELPADSKDHSTVHANLLSTLLDPRLARPLRVVDSGLRLHVPAAGLYTHADVMVVYESPDFAAGRNDTIVNPLLIIEVLQHGTRDYDRRAKVGMYKGILSLKEYVLVDSETAHIECYRSRGGGRWVLTSYRGLDSTCCLESVDREISLRSVYEDVTWLE